MQLLTRFRPTLFLQALALPILLGDPGKLTKLTGETTSLSVLQDDMIVFIHKRPGQGIIQVVNPVGTRLPAHSTGSGKVILAHLPSSELLNIYPGEELKKLTSNTIVRRRDLLKVLEEVGRNGYAFDDEESVTGVWAVASCVRDSDGAPVAALSIVGPQVRLQEKDTSNWYQLVKETAAEISLFLGFRSDVSEST